MGEETSQRTVRTSRRRILRHPDQRCVHACPDIDVKIANVPGIQMHANDRIRRFKRGELVMVHTRTPQHLEIPNFDQQERQPDGSNRRCVDAAHDVLRL